MARDSITTGIIVAVVGGILLLIFGNLINDIMTNPKAIPIAQYNEKVCPTTLYFQSYSSDTIGSFSVKFQNLGDDGTLFTTLFSDKILIRKDNTELFATNSTKAWVVNSRLYQDFNFEIKRNEKITQIENFTISFDYGCYEEVLGYNLYCKQYRRCCNYQKDQYQSNSYKLVDELC